MKASLNWLKDYVPLTADIQDIVSKLTISGSKVEGYESLGAGITKVFVCQIKKIDKHPDADKLSVCQVDVGQDEDIQIVTNGTNIQVGDLVPVALDGAILSGGFKIKKGKVRGVESEGMFCSFDELNILPEFFPDAPADKIIVLPEDLEVGSDFFASCDLTDTAIEFEITSNRPDCFSIYGLAREAAITYDLPLFPLEPYVVGKSNTPTESKVEVDIQADEACPRYCARLVENVKIEPSPDWMQKRLLLAGIRPINTIVDITNYVLLETGHPMHAFDLRQISGGKISIRYADKEKITTLDGKSYDLASDDLVIADASGPIALAGVMGGEHSQIQDDTQDIVFEVALFNPKQVRKTAGRYGIRTESSARFERGLDEYTVMMAMDRACQLIEELDCGRVSTTAIDVYKKVKDRDKTQINPSKINAFLGTTISSEWMKQTLEKLGCLVEEKEDCFLLTIPSWRPDLEGFADIAEEIARFYDYNNIEPTLLSSSQTTLGGPSFKQTIENIAKDLLVYQGYFEVNTYSFESPKLKDNLYWDESGSRLLVSIKNAAEDQSVMRLSMIPSMLKVVANNYNRSIDKGFFFEIARTYHFNNPTITDLPIESRVLACAIFDETIKHETGVLFYDLKRVVSELTQVFGIRKIKTQACDEKTAQVFPEYPSLNPYRSAQIIANNSIIGVLGYLHPALCEAFEVSEKTAILLLNMDRLNDMATFKRKQKPLPKHPAISRDMACLVSDSVLVGDLQESIEKTGRPLIEKVSLFDIYKGDRVAEGYQSVAFNLKFRAEDKTLKNEDIEPVMQKITDTLKKKYSVELR